MATKIYLEPRKFFFIRVSPKLHAAVSNAAAIKGEKINDYVKKILALKMGVKEK